MNTESFRSTNPALELAAALAQALGRSTPMPLRAQDEAMLACAERFRFGPADSRPAWSIGTGPLVLLVHGYAGRGAQMAVLAQAIAARGYRAVFFDAGGHGDARAEKIGFATFIADTREIVAYLGAPIHALIGHSAGALAMMRARALHEVRAARYAVIAAPIYPYVPLASMRARGAPDAALEHVKSILADQFQTEWSTLAAGVAFSPEQGKPLLAIYDTMDERVSHTDADFLERHWPGCKVLKTSGHGHNRILQAPETVAAVCDLLEQGH